MAGAGGLLIYGADLAGALLRLMRSNFGVASTTRSDRGKATHSAGASACAGIQGSSQARASNRRTGGKIRSDKVRSMNGKALIPSGYRPRLPQRGA